MSLWQKTSPRKRMGSQPKGKFGKKKMRMGREVTEMQRVAGSELFGSLAGGEEGKRRGKKWTLFFHFQNYILMYRVAQL